MVQPLIPSPSPRGLETAEAGRMTFRWPIQTLLDALIEKRMR